MPEIEDAKKRLAAISYLLTMAFYIWYVYSKDVRRWQSGKRVRDLFRATRETPLIQDLNSKKGHQFII